MWQIVTSKRTQISLIVLLCFIVLLPVVARQVLIAVIKANGFDEVVINNVDINVFDAKVSIDGVSVKHQQQPKLSVDKLLVDINWIALFQSQITIESLLIKKANFDIIQQPSGAWQIIVPLAPTTEPATEPQPANQAQTLPKFAIDQLIIEDINVSIQTDYGKGVFELDRLQLNNFSSWQDQSAQLALQAAWNGRPISAQFSAQLSQETPTFNGQIQASSLALDAFSSLLPKPLHNLQAKLGLSFKLNGKRHSDNSVELHVAGATSVDQFSIAYSHLTVGFKELLLQGEVQLLHSGQGLSYQVLGETSLSQLAVTDNTQKLSLLSLSSLSIQDVSLNQSLQASIGQINLKNIGLLKTASSNDYWQRQQSITLQQFQFHPDNGIEIDQLALAGGEYQLQLGKDSDIAELTLLQQSLAAFTADPTTAPTKTTTSDDPEVETEPATNADSDTPMALTLHQLSINAPNHFRFSDQRLSTPFNGEFNVNTLSLTNIQLNQPAEVSELVFDGGFGEFSKIALKGDLMLFAPKPELNLEGTLAEISLPQISPYMEAYMGYQLQTGQYDHDFSIKLSQDQIDMTNDLSLRQLALVEVDANSAKPMTEHLDIPLPMALDLLRDGDGHISLSVPVNGNLNEPGIGISSVTSQALAIAIQKGSLNYLSYALQPYGAALMAVNYIADQASTIQFDPIVFNPASNQVSPEHQLYIEKLAALLTQRKAINLTLCGRSNLNDKQQLQTLPTEDQQKSSIEEQLLALASQRAKEIKRLFAQHNIEGSRLFICKPSYSDEEPAGVLLSM